MRGGSAPPADGSDGARRPPAESRGVDRRMLKRTGLFRKEQRWWRRHCWRRGSLPSPVLAPALLCAAGERGGPDLLPTAAAAAFWAGVAHPAAAEEVKELRSRVVALEEKLQLALAPFLQLEAPGLEGIPTDPISLLAHSLQQLDRIDSLSEQISFLEERLETCSCKNEL